jgi:oxalate---CoA ligase
LAIVDTPAPVRVEPNLPQVDSRPQKLSKILSRLTTLRSLNFQQRKEYIRYGLLNHCMFGKLRTPYRFYLHYIKRADLELGTIDVCWINTQARNNYVAKSMYSGKVTLFCSDNMLLESVNNPALNWDKIATGGADIYSIPGSNHSTIIQEPLVRILADRLMVVLDD